MTSNTTTPPTFEVIALTKRFGSTRALNGVDFSRGGVIAGVTAVAFQRAISPY